MTSNWNMQGLCHITCSALWIFKSQMSGFELKGDFGRAYR